MKVAILEDYARASQSFGDWSEIQRRAEVTVVSQPLDEAAMVELLQPFDILCVMRDRTTITEEMLDKLPNLRAIILSDPYVRTVDRAAAAARGIAIVEGKAPEGTPITPHDTAELVWGLLLAMVRHIPAEVEHLRQGRWQSTLGTSLAGKTLGIVGLGRTGSRVARYAHAFDMTVLAWSQNLTPEIAAQHGARLVDKEALFQESDVVTIHYALSDRSRGLVGAREIGLMKPTSYLINSSRGPIIDERALIAALEDRRIAGAGLDVFDQEPVAKDHPLLKLGNVVATPHLGFVTETTMGYYHASVAASLTAFLEESALAER